jgi:uncharacterized protein YuzB (UPF0349 family)
MSPSPVVEYCIGNVDAAARDRLRNLDASTVEHPCLGRCGACADGALLVVDGERVTGDSHPDLLAEVRDS